jgi:hypothetical protein
MVPGSAPEVTVSAETGLPVVFTVKLPCTPTVNVALLRLVNAGGTFTITTVVCVTVAGVVAALVTVSVYVVVLVGEMVTGVPLVTAPTP